MLKDIVLSEFDQEMAATRRMLERLPDGALAWKPHEKSFSLGALAGHLSQIPHWGRAILERDRYDLAHDATARAPEPQTRAEVLHSFDGHVQAVRKTLATRDERELLAPWALTRGGHVIVSLPRVAAFHRFFLYHLVHHRGQLSVYLRLQNVPLPPIYGPTADEGM
jgi:uncharacterized damage-inducible protein DinB